MAEVTSRVAVVVGDMTNAAEKSDAIGIAEDHGLSLASAAPPPIENRTGASGSAVKKS